MSTKNYHDFAARQEDQRPSPLRPEDFIEFPDLFVTEGATAGSAITRHLVQDELFLLERQAS